MSCLRRGHSIASRYTDAEVACTACRLFLRPAHENATLSYVHLSRCRSTRLGSKSGSHSAGKSR